MLGAARGSVPLSPTALPLCALCNFPASWFSCLELKTIITFSAVFISAVKASRTLTALSLVVVVVMQLLHVFII